MADTQAVPFSAPVASHPYRFAEAFRDPPKASIRALMPFAMRPGTVSMAGGYPARELFDVAGLRDANDKVMTRLADYLQYSSVEGQPSLRKAFAQLSHERGIECDMTTEIAVTGGSQQALSLIARVMLEPGDNAIVETAAYTNTIHAIRYTGAAVHTVASTPEGMDLDALEAMLPRVRPKLVCVVASFSNPLGATLTREQRLRLLALAKQYAFLIVEDDPYGELRFDGTDIPPILALADDSTRPWAVYLASMSKTLSPGMRLGWIVATPEIVRRCVCAKSADDMAAPAWTQEIAAQYLADGHYHRHVPRIKAAYGARCQALADALTALLPDDVTFKKPEGGMFLWARLNGPEDAQTLLPYAIEHEVVYVPGNVFYADPAHADKFAMRMSFATMNEENIRLGISRLKLALQACREKRPCPIVLP